MTMLNAKNARLSFFWSLINPRQNASVPRNPTNIGDSAFLAIILVTLARAVGLINVLVAILLPTDRRKIIHASVRRAFGMMPNRNLKIVNSVTKTAVPAKDPKILIVLHVGLDE